MTEKILKIISNSSRGAAIFLNKNYKNDLSQIEKYAQIGKLSSGLIHDLISPITSLSLQLEVLNSKDYKNEKYLNSIKDSIENVANYSKLIKSYISNNQKELKIDLIKTINEAVSLISYKAIKENIQIQFIGEEKIFIKTKPILIYQIIISLLSNAIESFDKNGHNRKIIIKIYREQNKIFFSIKDFGRGIKNTKIIFKTFYTTKKETGGTGIGLSTVKHIVEKEFHGKIFVESSPNIGSEFKIII